MTARPRLIAPPAVPLTHAPTGPVELELGPDLVALLADLRKRGPLDVDAAVERAIVAALDQAERERGLVCLLCGEALDAKDGVVCGRSCSASKQASPTSAYGVRSSYSEKQALRDMTPGAALFRVRLDRRSGRLSVGEAWGLVVDPTGVRLLGVGTRWAFFERRAAP